MNIGIDARMYGPKQTGIGNYVKYLIENLMRIDKKNIYYIFLRREEFERFKIYDLRFKKVLTDYPWYSFAEQTLFLRALLKHPLDIMHFPHFNAPLFYNKPFVVTIHDLTPKFFPGEKVGNSWLRRKAYDAVLDHAIKKSRAIITPSRAVKNDILSNFSVNPEKIHVIYEGIPLKSQISLMSEASVLRRQSLKSQIYNLKLETIKNVSPYILYVGVWRSHKNLKGLIDAFSLLKKQGMPHKLVIVGEPDIYYNDVFEYWKKLGLENEIVAPGFLKDNELKSWYERASLLVLPSFQEGFGLTPLQALSLGVPVAVSDIPVLREVLGECARYFDPRNPRDMARVIKETIENKKIANEKTIKAQVLLQQYDWNRMAKETLQVYQAIITNPN